MGIDIHVAGLTKSFGPQVIWQDVSLTLPAGEISVMLGPSGTGKTVFLKSLLGLIKPEQGRVLVEGTDMVAGSDRKVFRARRKFGLMFQDGALFGSMNLFDNIAFPLRQHTRATEAEIRRKVLERMAMVGLDGEEAKLPGQISGGMRKRAGLARALVLDPQIILCDEPDSGLDPVRTALLSQVLLDVNTVTDCTMLIVTHNIEIAATLPDNIGMLYRRDLVAFGPRELLLTSDQPAVAQFLHGSTLGPIGMAEEKDDAELARTPGTRTFDIPDQLRPSPGLPDRQGAHRHHARVMAELHRLPASARNAITAKLTDPPSQTS
ncbi:ABC transporter ATP-binding protein [Actinomadura violacea]|uniref:ATP-binding cassette domain-containing protein n=1 Tax=Actinomadura violacea TaxID=2819934 RepID=A0ABS3RLD9_9ACTN|nr:ATP-binding cassette domain-containing protein [Actinomadura violacea]MBO2457558.1 ATP-binding cassette domain-containing protein [Actinomadura violacea]